MRRILICEDEEQIVSFLKHELEHEGYAVDAVYDGGEAYRFFTQTRYDLVLLDIMLPVKNGLETLRAIRRVNTTPVIMLTARKDVFDKVAFLDAGADDYVIKPFDTMELLARIRRALARAGTDRAESGGNETDIIESGLIVDEAGCRVLFNGEALPLTKTEFDILVYLYRHRGTVKTRNEILDAVYGVSVGDSNIVDVNVKNIRKKIAADKNPIETVRGRGYVLR